ncbi:hypothetical protein BC940DRAFT_137377 [Gongronella butleri]|nr:hypothetical protein BC940DRAFT_137377 [Gongronella butleri]
MGNSASTEQMTTNQLDRHERTPRDAASDMASAHHSLDVDHFSINDPATPSSQSAMSSPASPASASAGVGGTSSSPVVVTAAPASLHPSGWTSSTSNNTGSSSPRPVPGRTGWVSSTGASSPWFSGSYSSSTSSSHQHGPPSMSQPSQTAQPSAAAAATAAQGPSAASTGAPHPTTRPHRPSISGPYYRARGHSVNQQQEPTEEDVLAYTHATFAPQPPSPSTSSTAHPPRLHLQQMTISTPSPAATNSPTTAKADTSTSSHGSAVPESTTSTPAISQTPAPNTTTPSTTSNVPTIITWSQGGKNVSVTGTFNGWKHKIKLVKR